MWVRKWRGCNAVAQLQFAKLTPRSAFEKARNVRVGGGVNGTNGGFSGAGQIASISTGSFSEVRVMKPIAPSRVETTEVRSALRSKRTRAMKLLTDDRGQTVVLLALAIACLGGMAAFSVDVGMFFRAKRTMQTAADAAAIAGALGKNYGHTQQSALDASSQNGITDKVNGASVTVNGPSGPLSGPHAGNPNYVEVIISQSQPTYFMKIFHLSSVMVSTRAVATNLPGQGCIYTLDNTSTNIGLTNSGVVSMPGCGILVDGTGSGALTLKGSASISTGSIGIVGGYTGCAGCLTPAPVTGILPAPDPLASKVSPPQFSTSSCLPDPKINDTETIGPLASDGSGVICYDALSVSGSANLTLKPGVYVILGNFSSAGGAIITGHAVTIYLPAPAGSVSLTGSGAVNLYAPNASPAANDPTSKDYAPLDYCPTACPYNSVLFYQQAGNTNTMKVAGSSTSTIEGIFYAPSANLTLTGSSGAQFYADMITSTLTLSGNGTLYNYSGVNDTSPITAATLVE